MSSIEKIITSAWYRKGFSWIWVLLPLAMVFSLVRMLRAFLQQRFFQKSGIAPVIVVGNITVGGTGKTPLIVELCLIARQLGFRPGVVSRGYGSLAKEYPLLITPLTPVDESGDEALLIALASQAPVVISPDRALGINKLDNLGCDIIFSDDGLQHYKMARSAEIVLIDGVRGFGNSLPLPAGPLREPMSRLSKSNLIVINTPRIDLPELEAVAEKTITMEVGPVGFFRVSTFEAVAEESLPSRLHAFTGIGNPQRFFESLLQLGLDFDRTEFGDHHAFSIADFSGVNEDDWIVMTEKDAVKCRHFARPNWIFLRIALVISAEQRTKIEKLLLGFKQTKI